METTVSERLLAFIKSKGLSVRKFEISIGAANGFVKNIYKGIGSEKLFAIEKAYPDLNREWLLYGEGDMLKDVAVSEGDSSPSVAGEGNHVSNTSIAGNDNHVNNTHTIDKALDEIAAQRALLTKSLDANATTQALLAQSLDAANATRANLDKAQEQIDRLLALLEKSSK